MDQRDVQIIAQSSGAHAATIYAALLERDPEKEFDANEFEEIRGDIVAGAIQVVTDWLARQETAVQTVQNAFPGAQVVDHPQDAVPPAPQSYAPPPAGPPPAAPPGAGGQRCPQCNGEMWDNRAENARKRAGGYKLVADFKCKDQGCQKKVWPSDYTAFKNRPMEPRPQ